MTKIYGQNLLKMIRVNLSEGILFQVKRMGPIPRNTSLDLNSVIYRSIERILSAFDDAVQMGLVRLRLGEISVIR